MKTQPPKLGQGRGRKPVELISAAGYITPQDAVWKAIRELKKFSIDTLERNISKKAVEEINSSTVESYITRLRRGGYIEIIDKEKGRYKGVTTRFIYKLINDTGVRAPRLKKDGTASTQGRGRENMWRAMKMLNTFNRVELCEVASVNGVVVKEASAIDYITHLHKAGYLRRVNKCNCALGEKARYQLLKSKNTGALPPMIQRTNQVFDPNINAVVWRQSDEGVRHDISK